MTELTAKSLVRQCRLALDNGDLRLVVGAGASVDAKLPKWDQIAERLAKWLQNRPEPKGSHGEPSWAIECIRGNSSEADYRRALRLALYGNNFTLSDNTWPFYAIRYLAAIAAEIAWRAQRGHTHVISYNIDCLLELSIAKLGYRAVAMIPALGESRPYREIAFEPDRRSVRDLPLVRILHPHGLVPLDAMHLDEADLCKLPLTMSAEDYEVRGGVADIWQNSLQVAAFSHHRCLFYGFSFADPSVRKLLRLSAQVRRVGSGHLAMLKRIEGHAVPTQQEMHDRLGELGVSHLLWSQRSDFQDQVAILYSLAADGPWSRIGYTWPQTSVAQLPRTTGN